jgi:N-acetylmuramoyl-L-alanine amidase
MAISHTVQPGDSITSLADEHGHFVDTIWNDAANAELKRRRQDMDILMPGDVVVIPDRRLKEVTKADKQTHRFKRKGVPALFRMQVFDDDAPRRQQHYRFVVDGRIIEGTTDAEGVVEQRVPPGAREGELIFPDGVHLQVLFGHLDPPGELAGIQQRLNNLGFNAGTEDGGTSPATASALSAFQERVGLPVTGRADQATKDKLVALHDRVALLPPPPNA